MAERDFKKIREKFGQIVDIHHDSLQLGLDVVLYFQGGFAAHSEGLLHFYERAIQHIRKQATFYALDGSNVFKKIKPGVFDMPPFWASPQAAPRAKYGLALECAAGKDGVSDRALSFYDADLFQTGHIRVVLPLEFIADSVQPFVELAKDLASKLKFIYGHAGYAVNMYRFFNSQDENLPVHALSKRFKGIDLGLPFTFQELAPKGIKSINWLTFLGSPLVDRLGGTAALGKALGAENPLHELPYGAMVQAGSEPGFGDVNQREELPHYHQVGRVLRPLRLTQEVLQRRNHIGGMENMRQWLARFDE